MKNRDLIEFYLAGNRCIGIVDSSMRLHGDDLISIRGQTYRVRRVTFAFDHADDISQSRMRCNVDVEQV